MARLSEYFEGIVVKRLSEVETDKRKSNQHEFNGIKSMTSLFGKERIQMNTEFLYLGEDETDTLSSSGFLTWYDAREQHPTRTEFRLYFSSNEVMETASVDDLLVLAKKPDKTLLVLIVQANSTYERQILWLFGIIAETNSFASQILEGDKDKELGFIERTILETIGIETIFEEKNWLEKIEEKFSDIFPRFPKTAVFSSFARETLPEVESLNDPDLALLEWINQEEMLFKTLERFVVQKELDKGFNDVDDFIKFSLSVHNKRKSRMGYALEHHLKKIFNDHKLSFSTQVITEQNSKPDFLFPGIQQYHDPAFPESRLTMLGVKSTCKERWNQVLAEANRIDLKHLFTLEGGISSKQTDKMQEKFLQLVLSSSLHETYLPDQRNWLMNLTDFIELVKGQELK